MVMVQATDFGTLLRRWRKAASLTQEELAERAGLSVRGISDLERGLKHRPHRDTVQLLADALQLTDQDRSTFEAAGRMLGSASQAEPIHPLESELPFTDAEPSTKVRIFLIVDARGYTAFTQEQGDETGAELAARFADLVEQTVIEWQGRLIELRGDEALVVFSSARNALRAAVAVQAACREAMEHDPSFPLKVGIGLDAGEAIPVRGGYRGGALNLAARLCSLAGPGEVLVSEGVVHLARKTDGIALVDRGEVRLKGLSSPVRVIQIAPEGELPEELPPLQSIPVTHLNNLPDEPTPFIGREREIEQIAGLLQDSHIRMVTLTGSGGTGKTRLALQIGSTLLHDYGDGVFFVSLSSLADPALVPSAIAEVLGVKEAGKDLLESLTDYLADKHLLLVLDNYEHLLDASSVVASLLDGCRELHVLVTSRIPLHVSREHEYAVPPLSVPDPTHLPDPTTLSGYEAVALFIDRVQAVKADFCLTTENAPAVAEICRRLDGLPLALELAAARSKLFPPGALLARLSPCLPLLTGGPCDLPARLQTVRGTIDWSYSLLRLEEQTLFARLAVFAGGCTIDAAEAICDLEGDGAILERLSSLVDQNLVRREGEEEPRVVLLETIREYAQERLAARGEWDELRDRHAWWYLAWAEEAARELPESHQAEWLALLEREHDNLRAALQRAQDSGQGELGVRLAIALSRFWRIRGYLAEGKHWLTELLAAGADVAPALRAIALCKAGELVSAQGRNRAAAQLFDRSLALFRELGDLTGSAEALRRLACVLLDQGDEERAVELLTEHVTLGRERGDQRLLATSLCLLAGQADLHGDSGRARVLGEESLALYRALGDVRGTVNALRFVASASYREGDLPLARAWTDEILALLPRSTLEDDMRPWHEDAPVWAARDRGDYDRAVRLMEELEARARELGDTRNAAHARVDLGILAREQGDYDRAQALIQESLAVFQQAQDLRRTGWALIALGDVARDQGDPEGVIELGEQALALLREAGSHLSTGTALNSLGLAARYQGDYERAEALLAESLAVFRQRGDKEIVAEILSSVGLVALEQDQYERAHQALTESLRIARTWMDGTVLEGLAGVAIGQGQAERAARLFGAAASVRSTMGVPRWPANRALYQRHVSLTREVLGEERFSQTWEEGRAMTVEQAVAFALNEATGVSRMAR